MTVGKMDNYIRTEEINEKVSKVSGYGIVREKLVQIQRNLSKDKSFVLDGRDIGTVVLPNADFKIFLTATAEERAKRRFEQDKGKSSLTYEQTFNVGLQISVERSRTKGRVIRRDT